MLHRRKVLFFSGSKQSILTEPKIDNEKNRPWVPFWNKTYNRAYLQEFDKKKVELYVADMSCLTLEIFLLFFPANEQRFYVVSFLCSWQGLPEYISYQVIIIDSCSNVEYTLWVYIFTFLLASTSFSLEINKLKIKTGQVWVELTHLGFRM